jgi:hypothetical protein
VFSPDGSSIAFVAGAALKRVALGGGTPATVATVKAALYGMSWNDDQLVRSRRR